MAKLRTFIFFREGMFYPVRIPEDQVEENVRLNPGTLRVETMTGRIVWPKPPNILN